MIIKYRLKAFDKLSSKTALAMIGRTIIGAKKLGANEVHKMVIPHSKAITNAIFP